MNGDAKIIQELNAIIGFIQTYIFNTMQIILITIYKQLLNNNYIFSF